MHVRTKVKDLTSRQFQALSEVLQTSYEFPAGVTPVCVIFEAAPMVERHVSMPPSELAQVLYLLELVERGSVAEATLTDAEEPDGTAYLKQAMHPDNGLVEQVLGRMTRPGQPEVVTLLDHEPTRPE